MRKIGVPVDSDGFAQHHIVPWDHSSPDFERARQVLRNNGIEFDEAANGVTLPQNVETARGYEGEIGPPHSRIHNNDYAKALADRPEAAAASSKDLRDELQGIAAAMADPEANFPPGKVRWQDKS